MRLCITGATGFVGSHLLSFSSFSRNHAVVPFRGDLTDQKTCEDFFTQHKPFDVIVHLAGRFAGTFEELLSANVRTTYSLVKLATLAKVKHIIYSSTGAVYGEPIGEASVETDPLKPNTDYGLSKACAEQVLTSAVWQGHYTILRFPNVYGPNNTKGVIANMHEALDKKGTLTIHGDGSQQRSFLHVDDACQAIVLALKQHSSDIFNIATSEVLSIKELALRLTTPDKISYAPANNQLMRLALDNHKASQHLGFKPKYPQLTIT